MRYFHVASISSRESITAHGLDTTRGKSAYTGIDYTPGTYLFTDLDAAQAYLQIREDEEADEYGMDAQSYDLWEVEAEVEASQDEFADDASGLGAFSVLTTELIKPDALRLF